MLQNPSKYHPNPLSHFLALHNSQAAHNARNNGSNSNNHTNNNNLTNVSPFGLCSSHNSQFQTQQQQQHTLQQEQHTQNQLYSHHLQQHSTNLNSSTTHAHQQAQFLDATCTTLDVGKSFTIAAILGLQNRNHNNTHHNNNSNNNNNHNRDLTNAINLSLNGNQQAKQAAATSPTSIAAIEQQQQSCKQECVAANNTHNRDNSTNSKTELIMSTANKFHCDNNTGNLVNPYLTHSTATTAVVNGSTAAFIATAAAQQQQQQHQLTQQHQQHHPSLMASHVRANSFAAAAAVAAVAAANVNAVVNGTPSALQSLQQLHQHHAQQSSLSFARDKLKNENHTKKSSIKNKRVRTIFTPEQLERLEAEFERQQYMVGPERLYLAHTLQLTEAQVKVWFQNRRIKWRKHHLELTQQRLALLRQNQLQTGAVGPNLGSLPSPDGLVTAASNSSFDENDEPNIKNEEISQTNAQRSSHTESESELSVCNDSMDADSVNDGGGNT